LFESRASLGAEVYDDLAIFPDELAFIIDVVASSLEAPLDLGDVPREVLVLKKLLT